MCEQGAGLGRAHSCWRGDQSHPRYVYSQLGWLSKSSRLHFLRDEKKTRDKSRTDRKARCEGSGGGVPCRSLPRAEWCARRGAGLRAAAAEPPRSSGASRSPWRCAAAPRSSRRPRGTDPGPEPRDPSSGTGGGNGEGEDGSDSEWQGCAEGDVGWRRAMRGGGLLEGS